MTLLFQEDTQQDTQQADTRAWIEVDLDAIRANVRALNRLIGPGSAVMPVVKADAYGHGIVPISQAALEAGARRLGVATLSEAIALRATGIDAPILLLCGFAPGEATAIIEHRLTPMIGDMVALRALCRAATDRQVEIHLEVDTGIGRAGVLPAQALDLWRQATADGFRVTGLTTHFADADGPDPTLTRAQIEAFRATRLTLERAGARFDWIHLSNSPALIGLPGLEANLVRPGLLLYGILPRNHPAHPAHSVDQTASVLPTEEPSQDRFTVRPALTLKARVATVRALPEGHPISYGATHRLTRDSLVATVLIGYGDGYPRRLSNIGSVLLKGRRAPILGRVCMDQTVVDVTDIPGVTSGEIAVCLGEQAGEHITVEEIALLIDATEHEVSSSLTPRLPRFYIGN